MTPQLLIYPGNEAFGEALRRGLGADAVPFELRRFPDGETYLRIDSNVGDQAVVVLCTLHDPNAHFLPIAFITDTLRELGARQIGFVAPYLAYMRQDQRFRPGEAVTSATFACLLSRQVDWLVTVDPHLHRRHSLGEIYTIPTEVVPAAPLLAEWIRAEIRDPLIVGPDAESEQWVRAVADAVGCPYFVLEKVRHGDRNVVVSVVPEIRGDRTPVLVDDIISSATTMSETARQWREAGRPAPVCVGVHGVFAAGAYDTLKAAGPTRIVTTNTIPHASNAIDVSAALVEPIQRLLVRGLIDR